MSVNSKMTAIADEIRELSGTTGTMGLDAMATNVGEANTEIGTQADVLAQVVAALEGKSSPLQEKTLSPSISDQTVLPDSGYAGFSKITVKGDTNLKAENIVSGVSIFGVEGTHIGGFPNGTVWTPSNLSNASLCDIHSSNGLIVIATSKGLYYSTDGKTWTQSNVTIAIRSLHATADLWVAAGNYIYYSTDGKTWTGTGTKFGSSTGYLGCCYGNGIWLVGGALYSTDGKTWTKNSSFQYSTSLTKVTYCGGLFLSAGYSDKKIYYSTDGITWTPANIKISSVGTHRAEFFIYENGLFITSVSDQGIYYSTDGKNWIQSNITNKTINSIHYNNGTWVAGSTVSSTPLYYSTDGKTWTATNLSIRVDSIYYASGLWVVSSYSGIYYSTDGITWTQSNITAGQALAYGQSVFQVNGVWISCGKTSDNVFRILYSVAWESA